MISPLLSLTTLSLSIILDRMSLHEGLRAIYSIKIKNVKQCLEGLQVQVPHFTKRQLISIILKTKYTCFRNPWQNFLSDFCKEKCINMNKQGVDYHTQLFTTSLKCSGHTM